MALNPRAPISQPVLVNARRIIGGVWRKPARIAKPAALPHTPAMATAPIRLGFFKLNVPDLELATAFWREAFGFTVTGHVDEPAFLENILTLPGQGAGPNLMLVQYKDGRDVTVGPGHGAVGVICDDIEASNDRALACDAEKEIGRAHV